MAIKRQTQSRRKSASTTRARAGRGTRLALPTSVLQVSGTLRPPISTRKRPGPLSLAEKINLLKSIGLPGPGTVYVTLSPSRALAANHAALAFGRPNIVDGGWDYATWMLLPQTIPGLGGKSKTEKGTEVERLGIWFKSEGANRRYLLDCTVNGGPATEWGGTSTVKQSFKVLRPDGALVQENLVPRAGGHVACVVEVQDTSWYGFMLMSPHSWTFWSCEVTRL